MLRDSTLISFVGVARDLGVFRASDFRSNQPRATLSTGATIIFRSADDPEHLRGPNLSGCWLDEASLMTHDAYTIVIAALREEGEKGWLGCTFTPKGVAHWTYEQLATGKPDTELFHSRTRDNPFLPADFAATLQRQYPAELAKQELEGSFLDADDALQVIPTAWVRQAQARWQPGPPEGMVCSQMGVDVAEGGADKTVIVHRYGAWFAPLHKLPGSMTPDGSVTAARVQAVHRDGCPIFIDVMPSSAYVCLRGALDSRTVIGVNNAVSVPNLRDKSKMLTFTNVRAASYWRLREALDPDGPEKLALPPDQELLADLTAARYRLLASGIQIEPKEDIKERLGRSPDCADAVVLAMWTDQKRRLVVY